MFRECIEAKNHNQPFIENLETAIAKIKTPEIKGIVSTLSLQPTWILG